MNEPIKIKKEGFILEVTIDRPKANAIDSKTSIILGKIFADFRDNPDLRVAILTGAGEKFFSAGWDLKAVTEGEQADADYGIGGNANIVGIARYVAVANHDVTTSLTNLDFEV